jgi:hypothetical protein
MDNIVVDNNTKVKKKVNIGNIEPITNIQIIRPNEDLSSTSSSSSSSSSSVSVSTTSSEDAPTTKKKKLIKKLKKRNEVNFEDYNSFSNPKKVRPQEMDLESEYSDLPDSEYSGDSVPDSEESERISFKEQQKIKQDLLIKIQALEKKGYEFTKKFTMTSDIKEMEFEYEKVKKFIESQGAVRFARRCLMACVTGIEFLNKKFDPFSVKLEGWSENVMENIDDYDNIFEKLHEKYSGKAEIAPELELLLTLGGSAFMFHLTNTLLKPASFEKIGENIPGKAPSGSANSPLNGNFMASMMASMSQGMKDMNNNKTPFSNPINPTNGVPKTVDTRGPRKEMKGPTIDPNLFGSINNYPMPPGPVTYTQQFNDEDRFSIASSSDAESYSESVESVKYVKRLPTKIATNTNRSKKGGFELNIM